MARPDHVRARIHALEERLARLRAEKDRLLARASVAERKRQTRRKIVIGGTVLAALEHEGVPPLRTEADLRAAARNPADTSARSRGVRFGTARRPTDGRARPESGGFTRPSRLIVAAACGRSARSPAIDGRG